MVSSSTVFHLPQWATQLGSFPRLYQPWLWLADTQSVPCTTPGGAIHTEYSMHGSGLPFPQSGTCFPLS